MNKVSAVFLGIILFLNICQGGTITVDDDGPADHSNIQAAISVANPGDVVVVEDGTYTGSGNRDIDFLGKAITVKSKNGPANCIIDCQGSESDQHRGFYFHSGEDAGSVLNGFIIKGGYADYAGGIYCNGSSPTISNCIIKSNTSFPHSGAGGVYCVDSSCRIISCVIADNENPFTGGVLCWDAQPAIVNCTIVGNRGRYGGLLAVGSNVTISNCIIVGNLSSINIDISGGSTATVTYSDIQGGWPGAGNIDANPEFVDLAGGDYHLTADSPCVNAGDPGFVADPCDTDIDGQARVINGRVDMGADELGTEAPVLVVEPTVLGFHRQHPGDDPQVPYPQKLYIFNRAPQPMAWQILEDCPWLEFSPSSGVVTTETDEVMLNFDTSQLGSGTHKCRVTVAGEGALNGPVTVTIVVHFGHAYYVSLRGDGYRSIQNAIFAAHEGGMVLVGPGTHSGPGNHNIGFLGKAITVRGMDPNDPDIVAATVVECDADPYDFGCVFSFGVGEDADSVLSGLTARYKGPGRDRYGIICGESSPTISKCVITGGPGSRGYGIDLYRSSARIIGCTISGHNSFSEGGGISCYDYIGSRSEMGPYCAEIVDCLVSGNSGYQGGGINVRGTRAKIIGTTITNNVGQGRLAGGYGGGLYCFNSIVTVDDCTISSNTTGWNGRDGGGIRCDHSKLTVRRTVISDNSAGRYGGGIYVQDNSDVRLSSSVVAGNSALDGGGVHFAGANIGDITNCTIVGNNAEQAGGAITCTGPGLLITVSNSILWDNMAGQAGTEHISNDGPPIYNNIYSSCIEDANADDDLIPFGGEANGNIDDDPLFVNYPDDLHLSKASPCVNPGNPYSVAGSGSMDIDGQARVVGGRIDMGADEYAPMTKVTTPTGGEVWAAGSTHEVEWESYGVETVDLLLSENGGSSWEIIEGGLVADAGEYLWTLGEKSDSDSCVLSVVPSVADVNCIIINSGTFEINRMPGRPITPPGKAGKGKGSQENTTDSCELDLGCIKWRFDTAGPVTAAVTVGKNRIYVPSEDGNVYALDKEGALVWSCDVNSPIIGSPAVGSFGRVYVGADDGRVYAIAHNGKLLWNYSTGGFIYAGLRVGPDETIYVTSTDGAVHVLGPDGSRLWSFETGCFEKLGNSIMATPVFGADGTIYIGGFHDPNLYAIDPASKTVKWSRKFEYKVSISPWDPWDETITVWPQPFASPVFADDGTIYLSAVGDPNLYAIDPCDGSIIWPSRMIPYCENLPPLCLCCGIDEACDPWFGVPFSEWHLCDESPPLPWLWGARDRKSYCWSAPAIAPDGTIYVSFDDPYLRAVEPNGSIKWVTRLGDVGGFTLAVGCDGLIYAAGDDGYMYVVDSDGQEVGLFASDGALAHPVMGPGNTLLVSDSNGTVWAIGGDDCVAQQGRQEQQKGLVGQVTDLFFGLLKAVLKG